MLPGMNSQPTQNGSATLLPGTVTNLINFVLFYAGWFACIYGLALQMPWLGPLSAIGVVFVHLALRSFHRGEALAIAAITTIGPLIEGALVLLGVATFSQSFWLIAPSLMGLWAIFGTTLDGSLGWLAKRPLLAVIFGAVGAPFSYLAADVIGAVELDAVAWKWIASVAVLWGVGFPALVKLATWIRTTTQPAVEIVRS